MVSGSDDVLDAFVCVEIQGQGDVPLRHSRRRSMRSFDLRFDSVAGSFVAL